MRRYALGLLLALTPLPVLAEEGLDSLVSLIDIYGPNGTEHDFDVAGIRCAALTAAQDNWNRAHGARGMPADAMEQVQVNLTLAEQERLNEGVDRVRAMTSVQNDMFRVIDLYTARFEAIGRERAPWEIEQMLQGDMAYCEALNRR
jgi:hypothetical protein